MDQFPKYLMKINGERRFLTFQEAATVFNSGMSQVEFGRYVLNEDFSVRLMTTEDISRICCLADRYSASK
jgi:hypothetical protein